MSQFATVSFGSTDAIITSNFMKRDARAKPEASDENDERTTVRILQDEMRLLEWEIEERVVEADARA